MNSCTVYAREWIFSNCGAMPTRLRMEMKVDEDIEGYGLEIGFTNGRGLLGVVVYQRKMLASAKVVVICWSGFSDYVPAPSTTQKICPLLNINPGFGAQTWD